MITKHHKIGTIEIELKANNGVGSIRTQEHKYTKALYDIISKRMLEKDGVTFSSNNNIKYWERLNAIIERFPGKTEEEIIKLVESDINNPEIKKIITEKAIKGGKI